MTPGTLEGLCKLLTQSTLVVVHWRCRGTPAFAFAKSMLGREHEVPGQALLRLSSRLRRLLDEVAATRARRRQAFM